MTLMARRASDSRPGTGGTSQQQAKDATTAECYSSEWERSLCKSKLENISRQMKRAERGILDIRTC